MMYDYSCCKWLWRVDYVSDIRREKIGSGKGMREKIEGGRERERDQAADGHGVLGGFA